jgi:hypothetical protein
MTHPQQLGFGFDEMLHEEETAHLPSTMEEAVPFYRKLIERHNAAMMAGDKDAAMAVRAEADDLAYKLNGNDIGIKGGSDSIAAKLEHATAAPEGTVPMWGQTGDYTIDIDGMKVRIEQDGIFAVGSHAMFWLAFSAHAVDYDKPFLSETGYRSFIGIFAPPEPGVTPEDFAKGVIRGYLKREHKGKPYRIEKGYVDREMERRAQKSEQGHEHD